jgi:SAM-dependent MidA family methyltransferase
MSPRGPSEPGEPFGAIDGPPGAGPRISEEERRRESEVRRRLSEAVDAGGFLRFDRFVEIALYAPGVGFYTRPSASLGPRGEYYTAPHLSPLFGRAIAKRVQREHVRAGRPGRWAVVELGAGDGALAESVIAGLVGDLGPGVETTYTLVERSPSLFAAALDRASAAAADSSVSVGAAGSLSELGPLCGVVLANELLDALPFRRLVRRDGSWRELGVRFHGKSLEWAEGAPSSVPPQAKLPEAEDGCELELCNAAEALPREIADHLAEGAALLIDYGMEERELVLGHPSGTLAAVRHHRPVGDPLAHPGLDDLSAFVNFTRVRDAARAAGLREVGYRPMRESLVDWGIESLLEAEVAAADAEREVRSRLSVKNLLMGFDRFRVLELAPPAS